MEADTFTPTTAGTPQGGTVSPLLALIALHGIDEAITQVYPDARVIAYADDCLVLHPDRSVLDHCQQLLMVWLARMGLTLNVNKTHIGHTLEGLLGVGFTHRHAPQLATTLATAPRMLGCLARAPAPTAREGARAGR
jgi:RNA-directed DNA polymerase